MPLYRLVLEGHRNVFPATLELVQAAIRKLASTTGPTFLNLKDEGGELWITGGRSAKYLWDDVSQHWMDDAASEKGLGIKVIKPKGSKGPIA
jgi:hypothetical protein